MRELRLTRDRYEPRLYTLDGTGTLRYRGLTRKRATATAGDETWELRFRVGAWKGAIEATDARGETVGSLESRAFRRGGTLRWHDRAIALRPKGAWRLRFILVEADRTLGFMEPRSRGGKPVRLVLEDSVEIEPGYLLFLAFTGFALAKAAAGSAAAIVAAS